MARYFNGGRILVPDHADWDAATWSLVSWFNIQSRAGTLQTYFARDNNSGERHFQARGNGGNVEFIFFPGPTSLVTTGLDTYNRQWHHAAWIYDGNNIMIYVNGILKASTVHGAQSAANIQFEIGQRGFGTAAPMFGYLYDAAFYGRVLAAWEVKAIADLKLPNQGPDLLAHWMLDGTSSTELDISGHGHHGSINDFTTMSTPLTTPRLPLEQRKSRLVSIQLSDSATVYLDIQPSGTDIQDIHDTATVYVDIQPSGTESQQGSGTVYEDSATVYVDLQPSSVDILERTDSGTVYFNLQVTGVDIYERLDAATVYLDLQPLGGECFSTLSGSMLGEGEASIRWFNIDQTARWQLVAVAPRWTMGDVLSEGVNC